MAFGLWLVSAGLALSPSYGQGGSGLAGGPILVGHLRLNDGARQHELQLVVRGDFRLLGWGESYQLIAGLRFIFDLD